MCINIKKYSFIFSFLILLISCNNKEQKAKDESKETEPVKGTPVTITNISNEPISEYVELSATSAFLQKFYVKSNVNGYLQKVNGKPGMFVNSGELLFTIKTKESVSIDNTINKLDTTFKFSGVNKIKASGSGYITQLNHQLGDYVQDGEQLAVISDKNSFAFVLSLPYELKQFAPVGKSLELILADGSKFNGIINSALPTVDAVSQTQNMLIKISSDKNIPENLIAKVIIIKSGKAKTLQLPKAAVLTNDVQSEFWVMKMIDSNTAVKVLIKKGLETKEKVEILQPIFMPTDKILLTGNFGLPDTAKVIIAEK